MQGDVVGGVFKCGALLLLWPARCCFWSEEGDNFNETVRRCDLSGPA